MDYYAVVQRNCRSDTCSVITKWPFAFNGNGRSNSAKYATTLVVPWDHYRRMRQLCKKSGAETPGGAGEVYPPEARCNLLNTPICLRRADALHIRTLTDPAKFILPIWPLPAGRYDFPKK
jgi:hypothetical protein